MSSGIIMGNITIDEHVHYIKGNVIFSTGKENGMLYYKYDIDTDKIEYLTKTITGNKTLSEFKEHLDECIKHKYESTYVHTQEE